MADETSEEQRLRLAGSVGLVAVESFSARHSIDLDHLAVVMKYLIQVNDRDALHEFIRMILEDDIAKYRRHPWKDFHLLCSTRMLPAEIALGMLLGGLIGQACANQPSSAPGNDKKE